MKIETLQEFQSKFQNTQEYQKELSDYMLSELKNDKELFDHREYIRSGAWGFGEDEFVMLWNWIVKSMPERFVFVEIGVHRGAIMVLIGLLAKRYNQMCLRAGISPMNGSGLGIEGDFYSDVASLHDTFNVDKDYKIIEGYSSDVVGKAKELGHIDILYIDGSHEKQDVIDDLNNYMPMVKKGGLLIIDDCNNNQPFAYWGRFWGIQDVSDATDGVMNGRTDFELVGSIIHNRVYRKI